MRALLIVTSLTAAAACLSVGAIAVHSRAAAPADANVVVGRWRVDVRDNGRLVSSTRFHNDLAPTASKLFAKVLARTLAPNWTVRLDSPGGTAPCTANWCDFYESSGRLTIAPAGNVLVFKGSMLAQRAGTITRVATLFPYMQAFTRKESGLNITVAQGQQIQVTVNLTFQ